MGCVARTRASILFLSLFQEHHDPMQMLQYEPRTSRGQGLYGYRNGERLLPLVQRCEEKRFCKTCLCKGCTAFAALTRSLIAFRVWVQAMAGEKHADDRD